MLPPAPWPSTKLPWQLIFGDVPLDLRPSQIRLPRFGYINMLITSLLLEWDTNEASIRSPCFAAVLRLVSLPWT